MAKIEYHYQIECNKCGAKRMVMKIRPLTREEIDVIEMQKGVCVLCVAKAKWEQCEAKQ